MKKLKGATLAYTGIGIVAFMGLFGLYGPFKFWDGDILWESIKDPLNVFKLSPFGLDGAWILFGFALVLAAFAVWGRHKLLALVATSFAFWIILASCVEWVRRTIDIVGDEYFELSWLAVPTFAHFLMLVGFAAAFWGISKMPGSLRSA